ncbi:hypothetical protein [Streptomyces lydicus]|uniref:hypothetical protein n=1 Tax=Streptomyces lydicus TaxID=47763 RepID=UPI0013E96EEE|nr:hypothetical protein [Streptomyces lydicus]MCZ1006361.1 hypothetical protein [Streptomyces lydicus]
MPVQLIKTEPNPVTAERVADAAAVILVTLRAFGPAVQRAGEEMGRSLARLGERHSA